MIMVMDEKKCGTRQERLEGRADEIAVTIRDEIVKVGRTSKTGEVNVSISLMNGGVGHCKISNLRLI